MSLWDPEAAGNAALYLRLPQEEMLNLQNQNYPGKTAVWVPHPETSYCKGIVVGDGAKPGTKKVERADGKTKEVKVRYNLTGYFLLQNLHLFLMHIGPFQFALIRPSNAKKYFQKYYL